MSALADAIRTAKTSYFLIELDFIGLVKRYAVKDIEVPYAAGSAKLFSGCLTSISGIRSNFSTDSFRYSEGRVSVELANTDRLQDLETDFIFEKACGSVYVWAPGLDWADVEKDGLLFRGVFEPDAYDLRTYRFTLNDYSDLRWKTLPETSINKTAWPNVRTDGGGGSAVSYPQPIIYGAWTKGVPLRCVDTAAFKYLICAGTVQSVDADYTAGTVDVYDKDGAVIDPAGYTFSNAADALGNTVSIFTFTGDQVASEPLSCSVNGIWDSTSLLVHPADIISHLMEHHSLLALDEIDFGSIESMKALLPGLKFASMINRSVSGIDVVDRILGQCLVGRIQQRGSISLVTMSTDGPDVGHLRWDHHLVGDPPKISKTPLSNVINKLRVRYGNNQNTYGFESEFTLDRTNDERCERSYDYYGEQPEYQIDLTDVQDEGTARFLASRLLDFRTFRHDLVEIEVPYWDGIDYHEGDAALLSIREGASASGSGWSDEKCLLIERSLESKTIKQKWWRIET